RFTNTDELFESSVKIALEEGLVELGDLVVITAGVPVGQIGTTNIIKVETIGEILFNGAGIGKEGVTGNVRIINSVEDMDSFNEGEILIDRSTDMDTMPALKKAR